MKMLIRLVARLITEGEGGFVAAVSLVLNTFIK